MMKSNSIFLPLALFFLFLFFSPSSAHNKSHKEASSSSSSSSLPSSHKDCFSKVYAFGDSYTDTGNAQFLGARNSSKGSTNRLCDGRLVIDFLCEALSLPPLPPYKSKSLNCSHGVNFAIAGTTALSSNYLLNHNVDQNSMWKGKPKGIQTQTDWFKKFHQEVACKGKNASSCKAEMGNALFWIGEMGLSDYFRSFGSSFSLNWLAEMSVGHVCGHLKTLLDSGAKYIVVQGLPPVGCLPLDISTCPLNHRDKMGCAAAANSAITIHNQILQRSLGKIQKQHPDCTIVYADYWNAYLTILMNPTKYQFEEPFKACCGAGDGEFNFKMDCLCGSPGTSTCKDPSKYINWDGIHLTEAMHRHLADLFLNQGFCQPSFDQLIKKKSGM